MIVPVRVLAISSLIIMLFSQLVRLFSVVISRFACWYASVSVDAALRCEKVVCFSPSGRLDGSAVFGTVHSYALRLRFRNRAKASGVRHTRVTGYQ